MTRHPLDPLSAAEIRVVAGALRREHGVGAGWRITLIDLHEPDKAALREGEPAPPRESVVHLWNRTEHMAYRAVVAVDEDRVTAFDAHPGAQPNITIDEYHEADVALRKDPRVIEVLASRGITDLDLVLIDTWAFGAHLLPEAAAQPAAGLGRRLAPRRARRQPVRQPDHRAAPHRRHGHARARRDRGRRRDRRAAADGRVRPEARARPDQSARACGPTRSASRRAPPSRSTATCWSGSAGRCAWASTGARASSCTRSATRTAGGSAASRTGCRSPRWSCRTATRPPTTSAARRSTSASGAWGS